MRAFDLNFARAAWIFDPNFMRAGRKPARPRDKIPSSARALRGDEISNGGGILSGLALNVGKIPSDSGIFSSGEIWSDNKILNVGEILRDCEISSGSRILNEISRSVDLVDGYCANSVPKRVRFVCAVNFKARAARKRIINLKGRLLCKQIANLKWRSACEQLVNLKPWCKNFIADFVPPRSFYVKNLAARQCCGA